MNHTKYSRLARVGRLDRKTQEGWGKKCRNGVKGAQGEWPARLRRAGVAMVVRVGRVVRVVMVYAKCSQGSVVGVTRVTNKQVLHKLKSF